MGGPATDLGRVQQMIVENEHCRADLHKKLEILRERLRPVIWERPTSGERLANAAQVVKATADYSPVAEQLSRGVLHLGQMNDMVTDLLETVQL